MSSFSGLALTETQQKSARLGVKGQTKAVSRWCIRDFNRRDRCVEFKSDGALLLMSLPPNDLSLYTVK